MPALPRSIFWQLGLSAYWFATSMKWFILFLTLGLVVKDLVPGGTEGTMWGRVVMVGAVWAMVGPGLFGYLSGVVNSRWGRWRPFVVVGAGMTAIALLILANAKEYWVVVAAYLLVQISDDVATGPYSALVPSLVPEEQRGRASGVMAFFQLAAQLVGGILAAFILKSIYAIFVTVAVINIVCALITVFSVRDDIVATQQEGFFQAWIKPWSDPDFRWVWFTRFLNALGFYLIITYLSLYLLHAVGDYHFFGITVAEVDPAEPEAAAQRAVFIVALLISFVGSIGAIIGGRLADKIGRKKVILLAGTLMTIVLPPFAFFPNFTLIVLLAVAFGFGYGAYESSGWALVSDVIQDKANLAKEMGVWQSSVSTPQILSGLAGMAVDYGNRIEMGRGYTFTFLFAALAYLLSTILIRKVKGSS